MNKTFFIAPITTAMLLASASLAAQIQALEVIVQPSGAISVYQDQILGETTDRDAMARTGNTQENRRPTTQIQSQANQKIEFRRNGDSVQMEVIRDLPTSVRMPNGEEAQKVQDLQRFESNRMQTTLPADRKMDSETMSPSQRHLQTIREQRAQRDGETIELKKAGQDGESQAARQIREMRIRDGVEIPEEADFELRSRDITARIRLNTVRFDPDTNTVHVITPSGQERELNHLPDQAIERFKEFVLIADNSALELVPAETGDMYYRTLSERPARVFGFIPRQIQTELLLNDETGEVTERRTGNQTMFTRFIDLFSF